MPPCPGENTVVDLAQGGLPPARAAEVRAHVASCSACRALVAELCGVSYEANGARAVGVVSPFAPTERGGDASPPALPGDVIGTRVGRYEIKRLLGAGGMGVVYEARDPKL